VDGLRMHTTRKDDAVSEIFGTLLLLVIAVIAMTVVIFTIINMLEPKPNIEVDIFGYLDNGVVVLEHQGGETMDLDTELVITIAGYDQLTFKLSDDNVEIKNPDGTNAKDGGWRLGEVLYYDTGVDSDPKIQVKVAETNVNTLVMEGTLQPGYLINRHKGGIWHFDEGTGNVAYDSLNLNHGTVNSGNWSLSAVSGSSIFFSGVGDKVDVPDSYSLSISKEITLEAWMKHSDSDYVDSIELDASFGYNPHIINVDNRIFAVVYQGPNNDGFLKTIEIRTDGMINKNEMDNWTFELTKAIEPRIIPVQNDIYAIAYVNESWYGILKTVEIAPNGTINKTAIDKFVFDTNNINEPDIIHISDDIFALAYGDQTSAILQTIEIAPNGAINGTVNPSYTLDPNKCEDPEIIHGNGDIYVVAYIKNPNECAVRTIDIAQDGTIGSSLPPPVDSIDEFIIDTSTSDDPNIIHVSGEIYAVVYSTQSDVGHLVTIEIANDGSIKNNPSGVVTDQLIFDVDECEDPNIIDVGGDTFFIAYTSTTPHVGRVISVEIYSDGNIKDNVTGLFTFASHIGYEPNITRVSDDVYAIAYRGYSPHTGYVRTMIPEEITAPYDRRGIFKGNSFGIYINRTTAFGSVNGQIISDTVGTGWKHLVLTYDGMNIRLYVNSSEIANMSYSGSINTNNNDLLFGYLYHGIIDEIAIYDRVLTIDQIIDHYQNPGSLDIS
jgi:hypothetical protein